jgi:tetratricopeptide (TPR) repeat protein
MRLRILSATLVGMMAWSLAPLSAQSKPRTPVPKIPVQTRSIYEYLDKYAGGDAGLPQEFARTSGEKQVKAMEDHAGRWINANPTAHERRRLAASAFALEVAREWQGTPNWNLGRRLISWACHEFGSRKAPPERGEQLWYLASVALIGGAEDWWFLIGRSAFADAKKSGKAPVDDELYRGHLAHAFARFPNDPRFALAKSVSIESLSWEVGGLGRDPNQRGIIAGEITAEALARITNDWDDSGTAIQRTQKAKSGQTTGPGIYEVRQVAQQYATLANEATVAAEARIRAGLVSYRIANNEQAIGHLTLVSQLTTDPFLVHLSRLIEGVVRERQGRDEDAVAAYRAALEAVPRAQTASTMLTARLIKMGRLADAAKVAEEFFAGPPVMDPWRQYRLGDFRSWPALMKELRAEFQ